MGDEILSVMEGSALDITTIQRRLSLAHDIEVELADLAEHLKLMQENGLVEVVHFGWGVVGWRRK